MKKAIFVRSLFAFALIACCPLQTRANTIAFGFAPGSYTTFTFGADVTVGLAFTLTSPVLVTDLGLWDFDNDGLNASHVVTVWTSTGTQEAQGTILSGTGATLTNGFRYISIVPVLLPAGNHTIGGFYSSASDPVAIQSLAVAASGLTYNGTRNGPGFAFPAGDSFGRPLNYFGPNFQFTAPPTPDSGSTWALLLLGVAATFGPNLLLRRRSEA
jgi:hypothetical protein